jgi:hypothetical protein
MAVSDREDSARTRGELEAAIAEGELRLAALDRERQEIQLALQRLRNELGVFDSSIESLRQENKPALSPFSIGSAEKVAIFRSLFRGRSDVYPKLWVNSRSGKKGYELSTIVRNVCRTPAAGEDAPTFCVITRPNAKQAHALRLLDTIKL